MSNKRGGVKRSKKKVKCKKRRFFFGGDGTYKFTNRRGGSVV